MLPLIPDKRQLLAAEVQDKKRCSKVFASSSKQKEKDVFGCFFFEVVRSRSDKIWAEPEWVVERRGLGWRPQVAER